LHVELLEASENIESDMLNFLSKDAYKYDGLIIRPINISDSFAGIINR